jgi:hypothetical protein
MQFEHDFDRDIYINSLPNVIEGRSVGGFELVSVIQEGRDLYTLFWKRPVEE